MINLIKSEEEFESNFIEGLEKIFNCLQLKMLNLNGAVSVTHSQYWSICSLKLQLIEYVKPNHNSTFQT